MEQTPKVSVIIPVYNAEKYLRQCLDSVVNQTLREIEIICVDDGSTDGSLAILREYEAADSRVKVLTQKNQYAGVARNNGMAAAQGKYFAFWDADDFFELDTLQLEYEHCEKYHADICLCGADKYDELAGRFDPAPWWLNTKNIESSTFSLETNPKDIFQVTNMAPWTKLFSAHFIEKCHLQFQALPRANDVYFSMVALALAKRIVTLNRNLIHYRVGISTNLQSNNYASPLTFCKALSAVKNELKDKGVFDAAYESFRNTALSLFSYNLRKVKHNQKAFDELRSAIRNRYLDEFHVATLRECDVQNKKDYTALLNYLNDRGEKCSTLYQLYEKSNPNNPKVSIIIPVYNTECYLNDCLTSVCEQTFTDIEIICIDDKSTDNSLSILQSYAKKDSRVIVLAQAENTHQGGARNAGLDIALGKYVWFIDADDYIDLDAVEILVKKMETLGDVDLLSFNCDAFTERDGIKRKAESGQIRRIWPKNRKINLPSDEKIVPDAIDGSSCTYFAKREFLDSFRFRPRVFYEDACFTFSALTSLGVFYELNYAPYHRRIHDTSTTSQAIGLSVTCITDRIIALHDISNVIRYRKLSPNHFGVKWFKKWARHCVKEYTEQCIDVEQCNEIILYLQEHWQIWGNWAPWFLLRKTLGKIIVSFTSYPARISYVASVIESIKCQTVKPDKILLWLAESQFVNKEKDLPAELLAQIDEVAELRWCEDIRPHKKYYYAMQEYPDSILITIDDDIYYDNKLIESLLTSYLKYPYAVSATRAHLITFEDGEIAPYKNWKREIDTVGVPSYALCATGVGGVLYPPHSLSKETFNLEAIKQTCLNADDLWLKVMEIISGVPVVVARKPCKLTYIDGSQETALWKQNDSLGANDPQFAAILDRYNQLGGIDTVKQRLYISYENFEAAAKYSERGVPKCRRGDSEECRLIRASASYRIGRFITWIPRKVRGFFRCYREHGWRYTCKRVLVHLHLK